MVNEKEIILKMQSNPALAALVAVAFNDLINRMIRRRDEYRKSKKFAEADSIRDLLTQCGIELQDVRIQPNSNGQMKQEDIWRKHALE
jgi:cysteinyl-tRNA synthetase